MISAGAAIFKLQFSLSPILLTGGLAAGFPGSTLPVLGLSNAVSFIRGVLSIGSELNLDEYFATFQPMPGSSLIDQQIGMYPFANQYTAANATINQPLSISMLMICPAGGGGGYATRLGVMQSLQQSLAQHNASGGLYTIITPSFVYTDCVMTSMVDVSSTQTKQAQNAYKLDFLKPLISQSDATNAYNATMSKIDAGLPSTGAPSGPSASISAPPANLAYPVTTQIGAGGIGSA